MSDETAGTEPKQVFLVMVFQATGPAEDRPVTGTAEDVVAVMGLAGDQKPFAWIGVDQADSIANPALVTPVAVPLAVPSPWHDRDDQMVTGLVELSADQLGDGPVADDIDHLLAQLATSRDIINGAARGLLSR